MAAAAAATRPRRRIGWQPADTPVTTAPKNLDPVDIVIVPRGRDIGGFEVRRALPAAERRMVGPFVFLDQMGPADLATGGALAHRGSVRSR